MDYTLKSLNDAFENITYKESKQGFDVYAFLLATTLDQQFILEYLFYFNELHYLTGDRMLIVGPHLDSPYNGKSDNPRIWVSDLSDINRVINHNYQYPETSFKENVPTHSHFLQFMHDQTRESYNIAKFIGLRMDAMPTMVFFENLDSSHEYVSWNLSGMTGKDFVLTLRKLMEELRERCHWGLDDEIRSLKKSIFEERNSYYSHNYEQLRKAKSVISFNEQLQALRSAYDKACNDPELRIPLEDIGKTIMLLENNEITSGSFDHLKKHRRRWHSRMPSDYREAIEKISCPYVALENDKLTIPIEKANRLKDYYESLIKQKLDHLQQKLDDAQELSSKGKENVLSVISQFTSSATTSLKYQLQPINYHDIHQQSQAKIPRVFISYSHDSDSHKRVVLEIAQKLREDGVDCWIDQFEQNPSQGFPRWMQQQINESDFVLLVCTANYKRRFDGLEEIGRGLGVNFEGHLILQELYDSSTRNQKYIPIIFPSASQGDIPKVLRGSMSYRIPSEYESLYRRINNQPEIFPQQLGSLKIY